MQDMSHRGEPATSGQAGNAIAALVTASLVVSAASIWRWAVALATSDIELSDADRSLLVVMGRVLAPASLHAFAEALQTLATGPSASAFDDLPADADDPARQDLAVRLLPLALDIRALLPGLSDAAAIPGAASAAARTIDVALGDLYNPAQVDVLRRIRRLRRPRRTKPGPSDPRPRGPRPRAAPRRRIRGRPANGAAARRPAPLSARSR